jgi:hypothetical protein
MAKRVSLLGIVAIAILVFFIWNNPHGTADAVGEFLDSVGRVASQAWHRIGDFFQSLAK